MSRLITQPWLFEGSSAMTPERRMQWLAACYVESAVDDQLRDPLRSVVALYPSGAGLSTSLALLAQHKFLIVEYPPTAWPGGEGAFTSAQSHFSQWMGRLAWHIRDHLDQNPLLISRLAAENHEFLVWLLRRYVNPRQGDTWLRKLRVSLPDDVYEQVVQDLDANGLDRAYGETIDAIYGLIDECIEIAQLLGYQAIYIAIDISWLDWVQRNHQQRAALAMQVRQLLSNITPFQRPRFGIKLGLPTLLEIPQIEIEQLARSRVTVSSFRWDAPQLRQIVQQTVAAATDGALDAADWCLPPYWQPLYADLCAIWGQPGPAAAVALARCIAEQPHPLTIDDQHVYHVRRRLYTEFAPLMLDRDASRRRIWRGRQSIDLDDTQFRCLEALWHKRGSQIDSDTLTRQSTAGNRTNLDKIISRLRKHLEPFAKDRDWIYIQRKQGKDTWLEHYAGGIDFLHQVSSTA